MRTDRELLELAAKAAGMKLVYAPDNGPLRGCQFIDGKSAAWNPLTNDGDALRLAVRLGLHCDFGNAMVTHPYEIGGEGMEPLSASRYAIVRAAAEIGRSMP